MRLLALALTAALLFAGAPAAQQPPPQTHPKLFPPEKLVLLESPDRDEWQQPELVMDVLQIADGARVADLGAGGGWFTIRLAHRVGPNGRVYAEDIQRQMLEAIKRRVQAEGLTNVETVPGTATDPSLPSDLHAVLMVDTYTQLGDPVPLLRNVRKALAPNGLLGIVDFKPDGSGGPGPPLNERVHPDRIKGDAAAAGLIFRSHETFLRYQYLLVFGR
jgi:SAM-dependent methyltransferase